MKAFGKYISKYLLSFFMFALALFLINILAFVLTFGGIVFREYGTASPANMLEAVSADLSESGLSEETKQALNGNHIWAMALDANGKCNWAVSLPEEIPTQYTIQDVAAFSKGYLKDYPVFVRNMDNGLLVLGYPKNMDGTLGPRAEKAELFAQELEAAFGLPVHLWDERRTTIDAHQILFNQGKDGRKRKKIVDAVAASLILENYLDFKRMKQE